MAKVYKPYGVVNVFNIIPDFAFVVFECDGNFYFPHSGKHFKVEYFYKVPPSVIKNIKTFDNFTYNKIAIKEITLNSDCIFAFQVNEKELQVGTFNDLISFFNTYETSDVYLKGKIENFIEEIKNQA